MLLRLHNRKESFCDRAVRVASKPPKRLETSPVLPWRPYALLAFCGLFAAPLYVYAQQVYGTIAGNVTDTSGGAVQGAQVTITEKAKNVIVHTKTNSSGLYSQGQLIPGTYVIAIEAPGLQKVTSSDIPVKVDAVSRFDVTLPVAGSSQTVEVASDMASVLQTDRADVATTLTADQLITLPSYQRSTLSLEFTTPGVTRIAGGTPTAENPQGSYRAYVNGQAWGSTGYQLDGTDNQDAWLGAAIINPNPDSVAETRSLTA
jgi:hypothetical protein